MPTTRRTNEGEWFYTTENAGKDDYNPRSGPAWVRNEANSATRAFFPRPTGFPSMSPLPPFGVRRKW